MINGIVESDEARLRLQMKGPVGRSRTIHTVIDTGFTGELTLPSAMISDLGLVWHSVGRGILADGSETLFDIYEMNVLWDGVWRQVLVNESEGGALLGMEMLSGYTLKVRVCPRGRVTITKHR